MRRQVKRMTREDMKTGCLQALQRSRRGGKKVRAESVVGGRRTKGYITCNSGRLRMEVLRGGKGMAMLR